MEGCQGQFERDIELADSSRFQTENSGAPKASIPWIAKYERYWSAATERRATLRKRVAQKTNSLPENNVRGGANKFHP